MIVAQSARRERLQTFARAQRRASVIVGKVHAPQLHKHLARRVVFQAFERLQSEYSLGLKLFSGKALLQQIRAANDIGIQRQRFRQVIAERGAAKGGVFGFGAAAAINPQVVERIAERAAVAHRAVGTRRTAITEAFQNCGQSVERRRFGRRAGRDKKRPRRRALIGQAFTDDGQAVAQSMRAHARSAHPGILRC
jgi:hypothetical protein